MTALKKFLTCILQNGLKNSQKGLQVHVIDETKLEYSCRVSDTITNLANLIFQVVLRVYRYVIFKHKNWIL